MCSFKDIGDMSHLRNNDIFMSTETVISAQQIQWSFAPKIELLWREAGELKYQGNGQRSIGTHEATFYYKYGTIEGVGSNMLPGLKIITVLQRFSLYGRSCFHTSIQWNDMQQHHAVYNLPSTVNTHTQHQQFILYTIVLLWHFCLFTEPLPN